MSIDEPSDSGDLISFGTSGSPPVPDNLHRAALDDAVSLEPDEWPGVQWSVRRPAARACRLARGSRGGDPQVQRHARRLLPVLLPWPLAN
eukprot:1664534-Prymnesium_polylepis.1